MSDGIDLRSRALGCIIGGAMGDAFGNPIEFMTLGSIKAKYGEHGLQEPILIDGRYQITDDTQMTLLTADGLLFALTRWCSRGIAAPPYSYIYMKYRRWAQLQGFDIGDETHMDSWLFDDPAMYAERSPGMTCIGELCSYEEPATMDAPRNGSKGCGGLMRVAPAGLFFHDRGSHGAVTCASEIAASTHGHPYGYMTAGMLSSLIYHITHGEDLRQSISSAESDCLEIFGNRSMNDLCDIVNNAVELSDSDSDDEACMRSLGEGWVAEETLSMAVFSCLRHSDDAKQCLRCAVNVTGDSDSIGSVAGNIVGAYLGIDAIKGAFDVSRLECFGMMEVISEDLVSDCPVQEYVSGNPVWESKYIYCRNPNSKAHRCGYFSASACFFIHMS